MKFSQRLLILIFLALPFVLVFFLLFKDSNKQHEESLYFSKLKASYAQNKLNEVKSTIEKDKERLMALEEGCELILSVYAKLELYEKLNHSAKECLIRGKGLLSGISYDALSVSAQKIGQETEALELLERSLLKKSSDQLLTSLGQHCFEMKDYKKSKDYFVRLIADSQIWSAWLVRVYKYPKLFEDPVFVERLTLELDKKHFVSKHVEEKLLRFAKLYKLETSVSVLEKRLSDT